MWFNNVEVKEIRITNGWTVVFAETLNGHKVRGITKFDLPAAEVGKKVNMRIVKKGEATYVQNLIERKAA